MKPAFTDQQLVNAPPAAVWAALTDWSSASRWMPGVESMQAEGPLAAGTTLRFVARGKPRESTIVALEPGRAITLRSVVGGVTAEYAYSVRPADAAATATRVELDALVTTRGTMTLLAPVIRGAIAREDGVQLSRLKVWIEETVSSAHP